MFDYTSSDINAYVKDKLKMLRDFEIVFNKESVKSELLSLPSYSDIDRRCKTIIDSFLDRIDDADRIMNNFQNKTNKD